MRPNRLHDVPRAHEGPWRARQPVGRRGEPMLLAAVDMDDVRIPQPAEHPPEIAQIRRRLHTAGEREGLDAADAALPGARDHALLGAALAPECDLVSGTLERRTDAGRPVGVR